MESGSGVCQCRVEWLSRWLLMAHWRCTKAFDLSASLPCALAACPPSLFSSRFLAPLSPFLSPFSLLPPPSFSLPPSRSGFFPTLCLYYSARCSSFVAVPLFFPSKQRIYTRTYTCKRSPPSVVSTLSSTPVSFPRPLRPTPPATPPLGCFLAAPRNPASPSPRRLERIARYDLHSSRNKTSTTLLNDKRNRALSVL